jgi:hypothetical protein
MKTKSELLECVAILADASLIERAQKEQLWIKIKRSTQFPEMIQLSPEEKQAFAALLTGLDVPRQANLTAEQCAEAIFSMNRKLT